MIVPYKWVSIRVTELHSDSVEQQFIWCVENFPRKKTWDLIVDNKDGNLKFCFKNKNDLTLFVLRWK